MKSWWGLCLFLMLVSCSGTPVGRQLNLAVPLTGTRAQEGQSIVNGVLLAAEEFNAQAQESGQPRVALNIRDHQGRAEVALELAQEWAHAPLNPVMLQAEPEIWLKVSPFLARPDRLLLTPGQSFSPEAGRPSRILQPLANPDQEAAALIDWLIRSGYRRFALIQEDALYARELARAFERQLAFRRLRFSWRTRRGDEPSASLIQALLDSGAEAILYAGQYPGAARWASVLDQMNIRLALATPQDTFQKEFIRQAGKSHLQQVLTVFPALNPPEPFVSTYRSRFGEVSPLATLAYLSARSLFLHWKPTPAQTLKALRTQAPLPGQSWLHVPAQSLPQRYLQRWQPDASGSFTALPEPPAPRFRRAGVVWGEFARRVSRRNVQR
jgi:ABC-type branched-subunit amino acid transport system substrate-binding protein